MRYYAIYDEQLQGFKAQMAYKTLSEAFEAAIDRIESIHTDVFDDEEIKATNWKEFREELNLNINSDFTDFFDYSVITVDKQRYDKIKNSEDIGLLTTVKL